MKKYLPYIIIIAVLALAATWFIMNQSKGTIDEREGDFAVKNRKEISKIVLTDTDKRCLELTNSNGIWMVNGKYPAREDLLETLLEAITRVTDLCPVPRAAHDNVIRDLLSKHVHVEIFNDKDKDPIKSYWVGGPTVDNMNTYMLLEMDGKTATRPQMTYIPGTLGYLTPRFNTDEELWRTRVLFNYKPEEIKTLSVEYPAASQNSFTVSRLTKDSFEVLPSDEKLRLKEAFQQKYIRQYLDFYSSVSIEAFDNKYSKKDSILKTEPYCIITVTESDKSVNKVKLFYMPVSKRSKTQFDEKGNELTYDLEHYHAAIHDGKDYAIVQYYVFGKLLRNYKDFFFKPNTKP